MQIRRALLIFLLACSAALIAYTSYRAFHLSFTHDESVSYDIVTGNEAWKGTANHHPLNTRLMRSAMHWLGSLEWQLRLPNVLAHGLYLGFGLLLLSDLKASAALLPGFALLNFDPFMLDFFGLARGYGLALGLSMMSLFFLCQAWKRTELAPMTVFLSLSFTCAALADLANFVWLNLHLAVLGAGILALIVRRDRLMLNLNRRALAVTAAFIIANAWFMRNLARRIWSLQQSDQLYARGKVGFVTDTMGSLVNSYFYGLPYSQGAKSAIVFLFIAGFVLASALVAYRMARDRRVSLSGILLSALSVSVAAPITEHHLLGVEYPIDRIALYYIPLVSALMMSLIDESATKASRATVVVCSLSGILLFGFMAIHLARTANTHHTLEWAYDADTKTAMLDAHRYFAEHGAKGKLRIGNNWVFEPTINYYRKSLSYDWLSPATRNNLSPEDDIVFCYAEDLQNYPAPFTVMYRYPMSGTLLASIDKP